jgi:hypothetical protein
VPALRERVPVALPRDRVPVLRGPPASADFVPFARPLADLLADDERVEVVPDDFARVGDFARVDDFARVARDFVPPALAREAVFLVPFARPPLLEERDAPDFARAPESSSGVHLPDITRCAASATASAMMEPSFVALDTMLLAACEAVSAASSPASRILRRAAGLALIAAAAAARPAASISLLIAAFVSLSIVSLLEEPEDDPEELLRADLAMSYLPPSPSKTL